MKTKSPLFRSIGALLALLVFVTLPSSTALANCGQCADVSVYYEYDGPTGIQVVMYVASPSGATIFYTTNGSNPTHTGATPDTNTMIYYGPIPIPYGQCRNFRARAWKYCYYDSVNITYLTVCNPPI
jgi:hypothetical protein